MTSSPPIRVADPAVRARLEKQIDNLPVLPAVVAKLMGLDRKDEKYFEEVRRLIETDPNFSARVLTAANSAASAPRAPITSVPAAITRLGSLNASLLVLSFALTRVFVPRDAWEKSLWRHAIQVATIARSFAQASGDKELQPDAAYVCALLHDVGRFVMFQEAPEVLRRIDESDTGTPETLIQMERSICGLTHSELGAMTCTRWRLPEIVVAVVRDHHKVQDLKPTGKIAKLTALIHFADLAMAPLAIPDSQAWEKMDEDTLRENLLPKMPDFLQKLAPTLWQSIRSAAEEAEVVCKTLGLE
jgi:putative nucleotidyltransferase with HDIG domain